MIELNQYYTSEAISSLLASMLDVDSVKSCLELSAGEGALIEPIKSFNEHVRFTTVDLDQKNTEKLKKAYPSDTHINGDALDLNLKINSNSFDLAVCNPPFSTTEITERNRLILGEEFSACFKGSKKIRSEILFLIRNLFFLKENATLAIIIPDLILSSSRLSHFRKLLFNKYKLVRIVECEHKIFKNTEAKTFILLIKNTENKNPKLEVTYSKIINNEVTNSKIELHKITSPPENREKNSNAYSIFRGSKSSKECRLNGSPFHHNYSNLIDFSSISYRGKSPKIAKGFKYAISGDILIHRVGRDTGKTIYLEGNSVIVSDCIIVIRFTDELLRNKFIENWSQCKEEWLSKNQKGTCAKNISIESIKSFISSLNV